MKDAYIKTGRTQQKLETRHKILLSAQYYLNKGINFNLEEIAKHSGISRATVYRYFSNVDILSAEAALDLSTKNPESIYEELKDKDINNRLFEIQDYYNTLAIDHEGLFRKYISTVLDSGTSTPKRGARRKKALELVLNNSEFSKKEKEDLSNLLTVLMGIEPLIVTKDVCGLNNKESKHLLNWGLELIIKGLHANTRSV